MADYSIPELLKLIEADIIYIPKSVARRDDIYDASKTLFVVIFTYTRDPTPEMDMIYVDEEERRTKTLHIPELFRSDSSYVLTALQYLSAYSNYAFDDDMNPMPNKNFIDITLKMLTEFIMADSFRFNGQVVRYTEVLDTLNALIREDSLYDFILSFQYEWERILREKTESSIRNKTAYIKVCLWDWLKRWKIEEYNQLAELD